MEDVDKDVETVEMNIVDEIIKLTQCRGERSGEEMRSKQGRAGGRRDG